MTGVQISAEQMTAASILGLVQLLTTAEETTRSYGRKIKNKEDQLQRVYAERDKARADVEKLDRVAAEVTLENAKLVEALQRAHASNIHQTNVINNQGARLESIQNALDERGRTIDSLRAEIDAKAKDAEAAAAEIFEVVAIEIGSRVKVIGQEYRVDGEVEVDESVEVGVEGEITDGPDEDGDYEIQLPNYLADLSPESFEVIS